ncbi:tetratricopeptide repeat protein [Myxococcota bacterium]|nr:tetratricopeptide repeat protein [Myxococcota bacterium]MBU1379974.1 tetratricopeptide repeat protein [Myxococcota bacterium]MBU1497761.1 tetratricopeptide repeat protein [Myxococcota bacterium]
MKKLIFFIFVTFTIPAHAHSKDEEALKHALLGVRECISGNYAECTNQLKSAFQESKKKQIYTMLLIAARLIGHKSIAATICSTSQEVPRSEHTFLYWCARSYWDQGDLKGARKIIANALKLGGDLPHYLAASAIMNYGTDNQVAAMSMKKLIKKDPWLLYTWLYPNDHVGLIYALDDLYAAYPYKGEFYHNLAVMAWKLKLPDLADKYAQAAVDKLQKIPGDLHELRYRILLLKSSKSIADDYLKKALKSVPDSTGLSFITARNLMETKNYSAALKILKKLMVKDPASGLILSTIAYCYLESGNLTEADKYFKYTSKQEYDSPQYYFSLGMMMQRRGKPTDAVKFFELARKGSPTNVRYQSALTAMLQSSKDKKRLASERLRLDALRKINKQMQTAESNYRSAFSRFSAYASSTKVTKNCPGFPVACLPYAIRPDILKGRNVDAKILTIINAIKKASVLDSPLPPNTTSFTTLMPDKSKTSVSLFYYSIHPGHFR